LKRRLFSSGGYYLVPVSRAGYRVENQVFCRARQGVQCPALGGGLFDYSELQRCGSNDPKKAFPIHNVRFKDARVPPGLADTQAHFQMASMPTKGP
jgi:hypothetical protein